MLLTNQNKAWRAVKLSPDDVIDNCNLSRPVLEDINFHVTCINSQMQNFNFLVKPTIQGYFGNSKWDFCWHLHKDRGLEGLPTYSGEGATCGPDVKYCRHTNMDKVVKAESDGGTVESFVGAREDIEIDA